MKKKNCLFSTETPLININSNVNTTTYTVYHAHNDFIYIYIWCMTDCMYAVTVSKQENIKPIMKQHLFISNGNFVCSIQSAWFDLPDSLRPTNKYRNLFVLYEIIISWTITWLTVIWILTFGYHSSQFVFNFFLILSLFVRMTNVYFGE